MSNISITILNNEVPLDSPCWCCKEGTIKKEDHRDGMIFYNDDGVCKKCNDTGYILTDVGEGIMKLINRHGGKNYEIKSK